MGKIKKKQLKSLPKITDLEEMKVFRKQIELMNEMNEEFGSKKRADKEYYDYLLNKDLYEKYSEDIKKMKKKLRMD